MKRTWQETARAIKWATLPGAGDSGAGDPGEGDPGAAAPGTRLPGTDGATVEDLIRQLEKEKINEKESREGYCKTKNNQFGTKKEK